MSESVSESVSESISESVSESVSESISESISESVSESLSESESASGYEVNRLPNTGERNSSTAGILGAGLFLGALFAKKKKATDEE
ncbi:LPXTG cell wall anchor domain-containing protein [Streptococcus sp. 19428wC2_LYSM12]|nr:LPXTG cell wall anchor domain-containing protein [Streptococcus sp. 19428wC2_LYSM12]